MSDIVIHLFEAPQDIFEKIFKKKGEIIEKEYGKIETRSFVKKERLERLDMYLEYMWPLERTVINWIGKKYPKLADNNLGNILNDIIVSIKQSTNKKNIIIIFGNNYLKSFRII